MGIPSYVKKARCGEAGTNMGLLYRMSYVDVYCEKVEDLLATDLYNDTHAPQPGLQLVEDTSGYVVWLGAKEPIIFTEDKVGHFDSLLPRF